MSLKRDRSTLLGDPVVSGNKEDNPVKMEMIELTASERAVVLSPAGMATYFSSLNLAHTHSHVRMFGHTEEGCLPTTAGSEAGSEALMFDMPALFQAQPLTKRPRWDRAHAAELEYSALYYTRVAALKQKYTKDLAASKQCRIKAEHARSSIVDGGAALQQKVRTFLANIVHISDFLLNADKHLSQDSFVVLDRIETHIENCIIPVLKEIQTLIETQAAAKGADNGANDKGQWPPPSSPTCINDVDEPPPARSARAMLHLTQYFETRSPVPAVNRSIF